MNKAICFGAAGGAKRNFKEISEEYEIIAFTDNDSKKWGNKLFGLEIISPEDIKTSDFDYIIITSAPGLESIRTQLLSMGIENNRIITSFVEFPLKSRITFLKNLSELQKNTDNKYAVAEAGVFEGDFAKWINIYYPGRTLYLFDTFQGFDEKDIKMEEGLSNAKIGDYSLAKEATVMGKMTFPEKVIIKKGYFPDTAEGIEEKFIFVNLDLDLYEPTYNGLCFFKDRMANGGVILIHDYFSDNFKGPKVAVDKFLENAGGGLYKYPIGDELSIMVVGF